MRNTNKKLLAKIIIAGTLSTAGASTLVYTNKVDAKALPVATTKDYNKLQKLAKQPGEHAAKTKNGIQVLCLVKMFKLCTIMVLIN